MALLLASSHVEALQGADTWLINVVRASPNTNSLHRGWCRLLHGLVVRIPGFHPGGPGSIPGVGIFVFTSKNWFEIIIIIIFLSFIKAKTIDIWLKLNAKKMVNVRGSVKTFLI